MNALRIAVSVFGIALIVTATMGMRWVARNQPADQARASQTVLILAALSCVATLVAIWRQRPPE